jgi:hypothetical protein
VGHQPTQGDVLDRTEAVADGRELRNVTHERVVEAELALVTEPNDRGGGERLGDRGDPEEGVLVGPALGREVGVAEAGRPGQLLVAHDADGGAGESLLGDQPGHRRLEPGDQSVERHVSLLGERSYTRPAARESSPRSTSARASICHPPFIYPSRLGE